VREYEFTFVVQPEISDEGLEGICQKFEGVLERSGATRLFYEDWGRRRLAYEVQKFQKGHYLVLHFLDGGAAVPEMERLARLEDSVLRFLTVLADEKVTDIEARKAEAVQLEEERKKKAAERAVREAEEAAARAAEEEAAREAAATSAAAAAAAAAAAPAATDDVEDEGGDGEQTQQADAGGEDADEAAAESEAPGEPEAAAKPEAAAEEAPKEQPA
jgi:small subunit ribosomal protein S6